MPFGPKVGTRRPGLEPQKKKRCGEMRPQTIRRVEARIERWQATLAEMKAEQAAGATPGRGAAQPEQSPRTGAAEATEHEPGDAEKRIVIKFFFEMYGSPAEEEWGRRDGVISVIRRRMGTSAPSVQMVRRMEDISRYKYIQEQIVKHKGGLVQDFELQFKGCSKRKRKGGGCRVYVAPPEVAAAAAVKREKLRERARNLAEGA